MSFRIKKFRHPLPIPYDARLLRTGDCLVRIGCGAATSHILPEKYAALSAACSGVSPKRKKHIPERVSKVWDGKVVTARCYAEQVRDLSWISPTLEPFDKHEWQIVPLPETPEHLQSPPAPLPGASDYEVFLIPSVRKKTLAKTDRGLENFQAKMQQIWADRKRLFKCGEQLLHDDGFCKHSDSVGGAADPRDRCPRCGCTIFISISKTNLLRCYDCHFCLGREYEPEESGDQRELVESEETRKPIRRATPQEFLSALLQKGDVYKNKAPKKWQDVACTFVILCEGWLPRDVAQLTREKERAIESRAERFFKIIRGQRKRGEPSLELTTQEKDFLSQQIINSLPNLPRFAG